MEIFRTHERHELRHLVTSPRVSDHRVWGFHEPQPGDLTRSARDSPLVEVFMHFRVTDCLPWYIFQSLPRLGA